MVTSRLVKKAQKASACALSSAADTSETLNVKDTVLHLRVLEAPALSTDDREDVWSLYETNMRALTEPSSFGWDPKEKKEELFHRDSRIILVLRDITSQEGEQLEDTSEPRLAAFTMFRFDEDDGEDVLYCYECQVASCFRRVGLGRLFVEKLSRIGSHWKMKKLVLTVLKANTSARAFYAKLGFKMDPTSPAYKPPGGEGGDEDGDERENAGDTCDYEILSKKL